MVAEFIKDATGILVSEDIAKFCSDELVCEVCDILQSRDLSDAGELDIKIVCLSTSLHLLIKDESCKVVLDEEIPYADMRHSRVHLQFSDNCLTLKSK